MIKNPEKIKIETGETKEEKIEEEALKEEVGEEEELNPEKIEELGKEMKEYTEGLLKRINEIKDELNLEIEDEQAKELQVELNDLEEQLSGLEEFIGDIEEQEYEKITVKPIDKNNLVEKKLEKEENEMKKEDREELEKARGEIKKIKI